MNKHTHQFLLACFLAAPIMTQAESLLPIDDISAEFSVKTHLLEDYVNSYNFKCPTVISEAQLREILSDKYADNALNIMIESDHLNWRDTYVEARSNITCLTTGIVSKGY